MGFFHPFHFLSLFLHLGYLLLELLGLFPYILMNMLQVGQNSPMSSLFNIAATLSIRLNFTETCLSWKEAVRQHLVPSESREVPQLCCVHGVMCVWSCLLWGFLKSSPKKPGFQERRQQEEQQEQSLSRKVSGIDPASEGCGALGWHSAGWGCPGRGHPPRACSANTATGLGWLLSRQLRAQHKKAAIFLDQLVSTEIRLCLHLFYFGCFISVEFKGTGVLTFLINSWDHQGNTIISRIS